MDLCRALPRGRRACLAVAGVLALVAMSATACGGDSPSGPAAKPKQTQAQCPPALPKKPGSHLALCVSGALEGPMTASVDYSACDTSNRGREVEFRPEFKGTSYGFSVDFKYNGPGKVDVTNDTSDLFIAMLEQTSAGGHADLWNVNNVEGSAGSITFTSETAGSIDVTLPPDFGGSTPSPDANTKPLSIKGSWSCST